MPVLPDARPTFELNQAYESNQGAGGTKDWQVPRYPNLLHEARTFIALMIVISDAFPLYSVP